MAGLRQRRKARTEETIRRAAVELVYERGLDNVTTEMISESAGVSPRTFFNYFSYKEAALLPPSPQFPQEDIDNFVTGTGPLVEDLLVLVLPQIAQVAGNRTTIRMLFRILRSHPKLQMLKVSAFHEFDKKIAGIIAMRLGVEPTEMEPVLFSAVAAATIRTAIGNWADRDDGDIVGEVKACFQSLKTDFIR